jgi:glutamate racemase
MTRALVFDSGVGGLTIAAELKRAALDWIVDYAADSGFFPYGTKSDEELRARLPALCAELVAGAEPDLLVIACNTASTLSLADIRKAVSVPVVGTVPAIKPAAQLTKTKVIGILATPGTVRRAYLDDMESEFAQGVTVIRRGSAGLVDIAEQAVRGRAIDQEAVAYAVKPMFEHFRGDQIDVVVLACTHFPLIREAIQAACPPGVQLIDTGAAVARQAIRIAAQIPAVTAPSSSSGGGPAIAYVTGGAANRAAMQPALARFGYDLIVTVDV